MLKFVPEERRADLIYFNAPDIAHPLAFNPLESGQPALKPLVASGLISVFKKIWAESWGPRMEYILRNALLALLDLPASTLVDIPKLLDDSAFRRHVLAYVRNDQVRRFWLREYEIIRCGSVPKPSPRSQTRSANSWSIRSCGISSGNRKVPSI